MSSAPLDILVRAMGAGVAARDIGKVTGSIDRMKAHARAGVGAATANLTRIGLAAAGAVSTQVFFGIKALEDLERATHQTEGAIASQGGTAAVTATQMRQLAEHLENVTTADDKVIQSGLNLLLPFTKIGKETFPRAAEASVNLAIALAQGDVESANFAQSSKLVGKALQDPIKGMGALSKAGVVFSKQKQDEIKKLAAAGKLQQAQAVILSELELRFGKAGEAAAKGFGGDLRRLQDAAEEAQKALAVGLLPVLSRAAQWLQGKLADPANLDKIKQFGEGLASGFDQAIEVLKGVPWGSIGDALRIGGAGAKAMLDAFNSMPEWVKTAVITGWGLNKLTGGALGGIVGELAKGLIKGVLGIQAGVVNVSGGVVNGGPGGVGGGGRGSVLGGFARMVGFGAGVGIAGMSNASGPGGSIDQMGFLGNVGGGALAGASVAGPVGMLAGAMVGLTKAVTEVESGVNTRMAQQAHANMGDVSSGIGTSELLIKLSAIDTGINQINSNPLNVLVSGDALNELQSMRSEVVAAIEANQKAAERNLQPLPDNITKKQERKFDALRDKMEGNRIALVSTAVKTDLVRQAMNTGSAGIIGAIRALDLSPNIVVNNQFRVTSTGVVQTGGNLVRLASGKLVPVT